MMYILVFCIFLILSIVNADYSKTSSSISELLRPENVRVTRLDDVSAHITWDMLLGNVKYEISVQALGFNDCAKVLPVTSKPAKIPELRPNTTYMATVTAIKRQQRQTSNSITFQTLEPERPQNIVISSLDDVSVHLSWVSPLNENGLYYEVKYKPVNGRNSWLVKIANSDWFQLDRLMSDTEYIVKIVTVTKKNKYSSNPTTFRTLKFEAMCPQKIKVKSFDPETIHISWFTESNDFEYYDVTYKTISNSVEHFKKANSNSIKLNSLMPETSYTAIVAAIKSNRRYSSDQFTFQTINPARYYHVNQFDDLNVNRLSAFQIPGRPKDFNFENASSELVTKLRKGQHGQIALTISRLNLVKDTFKKLKTHKSYVQILKSNLQVNFSGESGVDCNGLKKEWFSVFSAETFHPNYGLFIYSDKDSSTVEINPKSKMHYSNHYLYFELLGIFTGMAIYHQQFLEVNFSLPLLRTLLHRPISLNDVALTDSVFHTSLRSILKSDPANMNLTFIAPESTDNNVIKLIENGDKIEVDKDNKGKYIRLIINWRYIRRVEIQMAAFIKGFRSIIPLKSIQKFSEDELQLLIGGHQKIDVKFWKQCTTYYDGYNANSKQIEWFWDAVESFNMETRSRLLQFVTGTSRFVISGARKFNFEIYKVDYSENLPEARTCYNRLCLPAYKSFKQLLEKLIKSTEYTSEYSRI